MTVRKQDVTDFTDDTGFDLAFLPAPFIPQSALDRVLPRIAAALRLGGWLMVGHGKSVAPQPRRSSPGSRRSPTAAHH